MSSSALSENQYNRSWTQWQQDQQALSHNTRPEREKDRSGLPGKSDYVGQPRSSSLKNPPPATRRKSVKDAIRPTTTTNYSGTSKTNIPDASRTVNQTDNTAPSDRSRSRRKSLLGALEKMGRTKSQQQVIPPPPAPSTVVVPPVRSHSMFGRTKTGKLEENMAVSVGASSGASTHVANLDDAYHRHHLAATKSPYPSEPSPSSSFDDQQLSSDPNNSKVDTFDPTATSSEHTSTVSNTQTWLNAKPTPPMRRRRSAHGCSDTEKLLSDGDKHKDPARIRPKAKSLRERRPSIKSLSKPPEDEDKTKSVNYGNLRVSRSRSRVFRSPPPPPVTADSNMPPSLPNVDVQQIKDEIDPPSQYPDKVSHHHHHKSMQHSTDRNLTQNIISNVKRKLSVGKDRRSKEPTALDPERKSLPANFASPTRENRARTLSNISAIHVSSQGEAADKTKPASNSQRQQQNYMRPTISFGQRQQQDADPSSSPSFTKQKLSKEDLLYVPDIEVQVQPAIPPVPPVPKHHSMTTSDKSRLNRPGYASRASSSGSSGRGGLSADENHGDTFPATPKTLRRQPSHASSFGDTEDSDNNSSLRSGKRDGGKRSSSRSKVQIPSQRTPSGNPRDSSSARKPIPDNTLDDTYKAMEDYYLGRTETLDPIKKPAINTRRRGKTLPGSLATPPPIPSALMPPMKLEPIKMEIPEGSLRRGAPKSPYGQTSLTPTRIPVLRSSQSFLTTSTPAIPSGMSSEEDGILNSGSTKTRRRNPENRLNTYRRASFNKSAASNSSSTGASPKMRPKYTSTSTTTASGESGYKPSLSRNQSLQDSSSYQQQSQAAPKVRPQTTAVDSVLVPPMPISRKSSATTASCSITRAKSLHVPNSSSRKNSTASSELDPSDKGPRPRTMSLHDKLQTLVAQHPIDEDYYCGLSDTKSQAATNQRHIKTSRSDDHILPSSSAMVTADRPPGARSPKSPHTMLKYYIQYLSHYEQSEIRKYKNIYFVGPHAQKIRATPDDPTLNHGYDDERGDYHLTMQDHLAYRYEVLDTLGQGSFGQVVKCLDHKTGETVAVKLIRNKKRFHAQAMTEVKILKKLVEWDPEDRFHNIRMTDYFYFRNHLCVAFECLSINLYDFIKSNNFQGFSLSLIRRFTIQMLQSLSLLYQHRVIHCDLKPENILLKNPTKCSIKIIDFGSSCLETERVYTYIQSRFYRAPEIILGITYGTPIDMWSLGCILAELYTGVPIFPGESEQDQLACIMEIIDVPPRYLIDQSSRRKLFFDSNGLPRPFVNSRGKLRKSGSKSIPQALRCHDIHFIDFIEKCLRWDPAQRLRPNEALRHEWIAQGSKNTTTSTSHHHQIHNNGQQLKHYPSQKTSASEVLTEPARRSTHSVTADNTSSVDNHRRHQLERKKSSVTLVDDYYYTASGVEASYDKEYY